MSFSKLKRSALLCAGSACVGVFLAVRLRAFMVMAWDILLPVWFLWVLAASLTLLLLSALSAPALMSGLGRVRLQPYLWLMALSIILCAFIRGVVIDRALAGTGVAPGRAAYLLSVAGAGLLLSCFLAAAAGAFRRGFFHMRRYLSALTAKDIVFLAVLLTAMNFFAYLYIHRSHTIYFGDNAGYWTYAVRLAETARQGVVPFVKAVYGSILTQDYNYLIIVPWVPLVWLFGPTRWVFIAGIINLALFPVYVLLYVHIKNHSRHPVPIAIGAICFVPMLFYTAVTGFVDMMGVFFALAALLLWLPGNTGNGSFYRYFTAGCLLAITVLLRRWYAFFAVSFFIAALGDRLIFRKSVMPVLIGIASFAFSLLFLFQPFAAGLLLKNYTALYSAFSFDLAVDVRYICYYIGIYVIGLLLVATIYMLFREELRRRALFLLIQPAVCFALFVHVQSHGQQHLLLYAPAILSIAALFFSELSNRIPKRRLIAALLVLCALPPFVQPLVLKTRPNTITDIKACALLPSFIYVPPERQDADTMVFLVRYLEKTISAEGKTAGILASSMKLNIDILLNAEASLNLKSAPHADRRIVWLPEIDSRDAFPGRLFDVDYLLVTDPVQVQLGTERQRCVALPASMLLDGTGFGAAYRPVGYTFYIGDGSVRARLYEKTREVTAAEKAMLLEEYETAKTVMADEP